MPSSCCRPANATTPSRRRTRTNARCANALSTIDRPGCAPLAAWPRAQPYGNADAQRDRAFSQVFVHNLRQLRERWRVAQEANPTPAPEKKSRWGLGR